MVIIILAMVTISVISFHKYIKRQETTTILKKFAIKTLNKKTSNNNHITAISMVSQCKDNTPVYLTLGVNGLNDQTVISKNSLFQIGSITKSFITVVILQIADEKNLDLDDTTLIKTYFPEYPKWRNVTLRQLLNMTSGVPANSSSSSDNIFWQFTSKEYKNYISPITILNLEHKLDMHFKPGMNYEYSNTNYTILGQFVKRITGNEPEYEVAKRIFKKLDLSHTYFPKDKVTDIPEINPRLIVHGYSHTSDLSHQYPFISQGEDITYSSLSWTNTAGAIISTPSDINKYLHALYTPGLLLNAHQITELTKLVSMSTGQSISLANDKEEFAYGLGIVAYYWDEKNRVIYLYNGSMNGFNFIYFYDPETELYLIFAVNVNPGSNLLGFDDSIALFKELNSQYKSSNSFI